MRRYIVNNSHKILFATKIILATTIFLLIIILFEAPQQSLSSNGTNDIVCRPDGLIGQMKLNLSALQNESQNQDVLKKFPIFPGGFHIPQGCKPEYKIAIIVPYRNRSRQLAMLLNHIHPILHRQNLHCSVFVVEQTDELKFNRGKLLNVGFIESLKVANFDCFVFHDIDQLLENDHCIYTCGSDPIHLSPWQSQFGYKLPYKGYTSGVIGVTAEQFRKADGFSNCYWGYGGEDDDFSKRVRLRKMKWSVSRDDSWKFLSNTINHFRVDKRIDQPLNIKLFDQMEKWYQKDGLNMTSYELDEVLYFKYYVLIKAKLQPRFKSHCDVMYEKTPNPGSI